MRHQIEKGTFSYENKERTKREKLVRTKWAFHRFGALTVSPLLSSCCNVQSGVRRLHPAHVLFPVPIACVWSPGSIRSRLRDGFLRFLPQGVQEAEGGIEIRFIVTSKE